MYNIIMETNTLKIFEYFQVHFKNTNARDPFWTQWKENTFPREKKRTSDENVYKFP